MSDFLRELLRVLGRRPHGHLAELTAAALLIVSGATKDPPRVPLAFDKIPSQLFELLDDGFNFLRRVLLPWQRRYLALLSCQSTIYSNNRDTAVRLAPEQPPPCELGKLDGVLLDRRGRHTGPDINVNTAAVPSPRASGAVPDQTIERRPDRPQAGAARIALRHPCSLAVDFSVLPLEGIKGVASRPRPNQIRIDVVDVAAAI